MMTDIEIHSWLEREAQEATQVLDFELRRIEQLRDRGASEVELADAEHAADAARQMLGVFRAGLEKIETR